MLPFRSSAYVSPSVAHAAETFVCILCCRHAAVVYPGMGMAHQLHRSGNGYQFVGTKCDRNEGLNQQSTFGYATYTRGLTVRPCRRCVGEPTGSGPVGGATGCGKWLCWFRERVAGCWVAAAAKLRRL
jgi:hypothetical protein